MHKIFLTQAIEGFKIDGSGAVNQTIQHLRNEVGYSGKIIAAYIEALKMD